MAIKSVVLKVTQRGFDLVPDKVTIVRKREFQFDSVWPDVSDETDVARIDLRVNGVLRYNSSKKEYESDADMTDDWDIHRGKVTYSLTSGNSQSNPILARTDGPVGVPTPNAHRLIKLTATVIFKDGTTAVIDPILDERPGG